MRKVLITFGGGRAAIGICRALRQGPEPPYIIGVDSDKFAVHRVVGDEHHLVPRGDDPLYIPFIKHLIEQTGADMLWPLHESEIAAAARNIDSLSVRTFLPTSETIENGQNKFVSTRLFKEAGLEVPETRLVRNEAELRAALDEIGPDIWLRKTRGAGAKGSLPVSDYDRAMHWIALHGGFEDFIAAPLIKGLMCKSESIWFEGDLIAMQSSESLATEFSSLTMSGLTGFSRSDRFYAHEAIDDASRRAVKALANSPHGLFATDMLIASDGTPYITEVNVGRLSSGSFSHFITEKMNAPYLAYQLAFGETLAFDPPVVNPFPTDIVTIKGWMHDPSYVPATLIEDEVASYEALRRELGDQ